MNNDEQQRAGPIKWLPVVMYHRVVETVHAPNDYIVQISTVKVQNRFREIAGKIFNRVRHKLVQRVARGGS